MEQALDAPVPAPAPAEAVPPTAGAVGVGVAAGTVDAVDADDSNISLETMLRRSLLAAERAALAGKRGQVAALLIPVMELTRALSANEAFADQRDQLIELGERAETLLHGDGAPLPSASSPQPPPSPSTPSVRPPSPPGSLLRSPPAAIPPGRAGELDTLLQSTADEIDRLEQARRRIAAL